MLQKQGWMRYDTELMFEWKQARDEGRDVEHLKELCQQVAGAAKDESYKEIAQESAKANKCTCFTGPPLC